MFTLDSCAALLVTFCEDEMHWTGRRSLSVVNDKDGQFSTSLSQSAIRAINTLKSVFQVNKKPISVSAEPLRQCHVGTKLHIGGRRNTQALNRYLYRLKSGEQYS
jgi:hypothetical protein